MEVVEEVGYGKKKSRGKAKKKKLLAKEKAKNKNVFFIEQYIFLIQILNFFIVYYRLCSSLN